MTEKSASDVLRELLDERGVEYEAYRDIKNRCITKWRTYHGAFVFFAIEKEGKLFVETASDTEHSAICTPDQAIAATLRDEWDGKPFVEYAEHVAKEIHGEAFALLEGCDEPDFSAIDAICAACEDVMRIAGRWKRGESQDEFTTHESDELGSGLNPDGLPAGLTISDDGNLLDWRGENYVKQSTLCGGKLTAEQVRKAIRKYAHDDSCYIFEVYGEMCGAIADELNAELGSEINGDTSDGYHTFNELYHHRAVLFSVIVRDHRELAWKARKHHDGTMYDGMFIVGIETPKGQATYHYDIDPYWEMFDCEEREYAPEWDGHTPDEAIARIAELGSDTSAARLAERLRGIADEMRNVGASSMKPHELLACYAHEVDKVADSLKFAATLGNGTCRNEWAEFGKFRCSECWTQVDAISTNTTRPMPIRYCPNCGRMVRR